MKKGIFIFISSFICWVSNAQSKGIENVFRLLPADKIYHLSVAARDSMLKGKTYYPASNSSSEIAAYNYGMSPNVDDYLYVSFSFETSQRGSGMIEIRSFNMLNGDKLIVVSKTGGVWQVAYNQQEISFFIFDQFQKLMPCKKKILPVANENLFMKAGIPDAIKKTILHNSNMTFDLSHEKLMLALNSSYFFKSADDHSLPEFCKFFIVIFM
jgi:hypothetical protein